MNLYLEAHAEPFSGDVLGRVIDGENGHLGLLGTTEERHLTLEEGQEEWKAEKYSAFLG